MYKSLHSNVIKKKLSQNIHISNYHKQVMSDNIGQKQLNTIKHLTMTAINHA